MKTYDVFCKFLIPNLLTMTFRDAFQQTIQNLTPIYGETEAKSMSRILFEDAFKVYDFTSSSLFSAAQITELERTTQLLLQHQPLQYILGEADFYGLKFNVNSNVLIPRPETEELVYLILKTLKKTAIPQPKVLDIGTGSGCIPVTLAKENKHLEVHALDVSTGALEVAKSNAKKNEVSVQFYEKNILDRATWADLPKFDIIVSNPPYIPHSERNLMPQNVLEFEPDLALFVENEEPLIFYETIADFALEKLNSSGYLFFECNEYNAPKVAEMLISKDFQNVELHEDMQGKARMCVGKPA